MHEWGSSFLNMHKFAYISRREIWALAKARFKILASFCLHVKVNYRGDFAYIFLSLHKSENSQQITILEMWNDI